MTPPATGAAAVMLVDDVEAERRLMQLLLETAGGFRVVAQAGDGQEALDRVGAADPDVILLDLSMPRMDGLEALPLLRAAAPQALVVVMSGFSARQQEAQVLGLGAHAYIEKGTPAMEVVARLGDLLARHGRSPAEPSPTGRPGDVPPGGTALAPRERVEVLRLAYQHAPIGIAAIALDGTWLEANPAMCALLGRTPEELGGSSLQELTHPDDRAADLADATALLAGRIDRSVRRTRYLHADGHVVWAELHRSVLRDPAGAPRCVVAQVLEVPGDHLRSTPRHSAEAAEGAEGGEAAEG